MELFNHNGFGVRVLDLRPRRNAFQVNIYNPDDAGHAYAAVIGFPEDEEVGSPAEVFASLAAGGFIDTLIPKAQMAFATPTPEAN